MAHIGPPFVLIEIRVLKEVGLIASHNVHFPYTSHICSSHQCTLKPTSYMPIIITLRVLFILLLGGKGICIENLEVFLTSIVIKTSEAFAYSLNWMPSTTRHDYNSLS